MPAETSFLMDNRIVMHTWIKPISLADINAAFSKAAPLYEQATHPVHTIFVHREAANLPPNIISVAFRHPTSPFTHPKSGKLVIVATDPFLRVMGRTVSKLRPNKISLVSTVDAALAHIAEILKKEAAPIP